TVVATPTDPAGSNRHPVVVGGANPPVPAIANDAPPNFPLAQTRRSVLRAIVDDDQLVFDSGLSPHRLQARPQQLAPIPVHDDDGDQRVRNSWPSPITRAAACAPGRRIRA